MGRVELVVRREGLFARIYAMKRLLPELLSDEELRAMFIEEARIAGLVRHPNVVPVLDVGEDEHGPYLVMDYVEGVAAYKPLVQAREAGAMLPLGLCVDIALQAARGLAAAHELEGAGGKALEVVHRDISPQNILLGFDGLVRVTDFGVARALDHRAVTESGALKGKIGYMSPEQIAHQPLDGRSDLFALGIVLYELLTAERLYSGGRSKAFVRIQNEPPPDVRVDRSSTPDELADLVRELLAKDRADRPATAREVARRLEVIATSLGDAGDVAAYLEEHFGEERQRQRALIAAALERTHAELTLSDLIPVTAELSTVRLGGAAETATVTERDPSPPAEVASTTFVGLRRRLTRNPLRTVLVGAGLLVLVGALVAWAGLEGNDVESPRIGAAVSSPAAPVEDPATGVEPAAPPEETAEPEDPSSEPEGAEPAPIAEESAPASRPRRPARTRRRRAMMATGPGLSMRAWGWDEQ